MPGPETITIQKELKRDTSFLKFDDNQNKKWNTDNPDIVANLDVGMTIDVVYELRPVTFTDESGQEKTVQSKYITWAVPSQKPPQELRPPYTGGGGGGGNRGGGGGQKKGDGDFRTSGELIVLDCLAAAVKLHEGILRDRVTAGDAVDAAARTLRASVTQTADVFCEYVRAEGGKLGKSSEAAAGRNPNGTFANPQSGWAGGAEPSGKPTEQIGFGEPDDDLGGL
jgi:hypothetical protein